ncbi:hypothetical protein DXG03_003609 [Asterophora parasitica]|uniref:Uncharacterized protein n=1 Tax=Asterophora parasitica TaxID=117018 RepID=A0A9P7G3F6_9AGAR|nr:hypothetical protein DXG03_003609 [Asterophora parasitica]
MSTNVNSVVIEPGFRGSVSGRAIITLTDADGRPVAATTLLGTGSNIPMSQEVNPTQSAWTFGPFKEPRTLSIAIDHIKHAASGEYSPSKVIHPVTVILL